MTRTQILARLKRQKMALRERGARALYLFGSTARGEHTETSDIDLFMDYDPGSGFSLLELVGIKQHLETALGRKIDITTRDSLHPRLRSKIEASATRVF